MWIQKGVDRWPGAADLASISIWMPRPRSKVPGPGTRRRKGASAGQLAAYSKSAGDRILFINDNVGSIQGQRRRRCPCIDSTLGSGHCGQTRWSSLLWLTVNSAASRLVHGLAGRLAPGVSGWHCTADRTSVQPSDGRLPPGHALFTASLPVRRGFTAASLSSSCQVPLPEKIRWSSVALMLGQRGRLCLNSCRHWKNISFSPRGTLYCQPHKTWNATTVIQAYIQNLTRLTWYFTHRKLWIAVARHNFKWVKLFKQDENVFHVFRATSWLLNAIPFQKARNTSR